MMITGPRNGSAEDAAASPHFGAKRKNQKKILRKKVEKNFLTTKIQETKWWKSEEIFVHVGG